MIVKFNFIDTREHRINLICADFNGLFLRQPARVCLSLATLAHKKSSRKFHVFTETTLIKLFAFFAELYPAASI
jgi:hypothetical protein